MAGPSGPAFFVSAPDVQATRRFTFCPFTLGGVDPSLLP